MRFKLYISVTFLFFLVACDEPLSTTQSLTPVLWTTPVDGYGLTILSDDLMLGFVSSAQGKGTLVAVNLTAHEVAWRYQVGTAHVFGRQMTTDGENIYVFANDRGLLALSKQGNLLSETLPPAPDEAVEGIYAAGPVFHEGRLYVPSDKLVYAYNVTDPSAPTLVWRQAFEKPVSALVVGQDGSLYIGVAEYTGADSVRALAPEDGTTLWRASTATPGPMNTDGYTTALALDGDKVIAMVEASQTVQVFDRETGQRLSVAGQLRDACVDGGGTVVGLEVGGGKVFVSPDGGTCVYAIDLASGKIAWSHTARVEPNTSFTYGGVPKYVNGVVYATNSALWALEAGTGKVLSLASKRDEDALFTSVQHANGEVLVWGDDLTAYKPLH